MTRIGAILLALLLANLLLGCQRADSPGHKCLVVVGCPAMIPLLEQIAERYQEQHAVPVRLCIEAAPPERASNDTRTGLADIGLLGQPPSRNEVGLLTQTLAHDALAFLVHRDNPVKNLDPAQLTRLLVREEPTWQHSGGTGGTVQLVGQVGSYSLREPLQERFGLVPGAIRLDVVAGTPAQLVQEVARRPTALGWLSLSDAEKLAANHTVHPVGFSGVPATQANFRAGRYTLTRPLVLLSRPDSPEEVRNFLAFACSAEVHDLIEAQGYMPASRGK